MIILDKKSYELVAHLLTLDEPETIMAISKKLNQSRRKIYYHLDKINEALPDNIDKIVSYPRIGIVLNAKQRQIFKTFINELDDYSYVMSVSERIDLTLIYIAISKHRVTIDALMSLNDVSRNTVLSDLNTIRRQLLENEFDLQLRVTKAKGYYLECHPLSKIQFLYQLLYRVKTHRTDSFQKIVRDKISDLTGDDTYFSDIVSTILYQKLAGSQETLGKKINPQDIEFMVFIFPFLLLSYRNIGLSKAEKKALNEKFERTNNKKEHQLAIAIADGLDKASVLTLDSNEISIITMFLLSFRKDMDFHLESSDYADMRCVIEDFIMQIAAYYRLSFEHKGDLLNQLLMHCKALLYRKLYGIPSVNPLTEMIKEQYGELFDVTESFIPILEKAWSIHLNEDDIAYIAVHIGGELRKERVLREKPKKVVIICDEGIGIQKLLMRQCQTYLKNMTIEAVFTLEQFYSVVDIMKTDMVISTNDAVDTRFPLLIVHPIMTDEDIIKLIRFAHNRPQQDELEFSQKLEECLKVYLTDEQERYALKAQIEKLVSHELLTIKD